MRENGASFVKKIVDAELDAAFDDPSKGPVVMIHDVVDQKRIIELKRCARYGGHCRDYRDMGSLESDPNLPQAQ